MLPIHTPVADAMVKLHMSCYAMICHAAAAGCRLLLTCLAAGSAAAAAAAGAAAVAAVAAVAAAATACC